MYTILYMLKTKVHLAFISNAHQKDSILTREEGLNQNAEEGELCVYDEVFAL